MIKRIALLTACVSLAAAACGGTDSATTTEAPAASSTPPTTQGPPASAPSVEVAATNSAFGEILVDSDGNTLYLFTPDESGPSVCNDDCAAAWPPVLGAATAGPGTDAELLGTAARDDGSTQATYNSWPLYYFAGDSAPGDISGQGLNDVWYVITPTGEAIN